MRKKKSKRFQFLSNIDFLRFLVFSSSFELLPTPAMSANMNAYIDLIMIQVGPWVLRSGYIPMELPDFLEIIEYRPLLITYTGVLHLTNGQLSRLVSVARSGNAIMTYQNNMLRIAMAASVRQITVSH